MLPLIQQLASTYDLTNITIVADAGMCTAANKQAICQTGLLYILRTKEFEAGCVIDARHRAHPGKAYEDGQIREHAR